MRFLHFLGAVLVLFASPAMAQDVAWVVTQKSGDVRVLRNGLQPASVQVRASLLAGDVIATGATGRAMLTRGDDYVVVAPGSRLLLPKEEQQSGFTRLVQQVGTMLYKVKHTGVPHFAVETPMLAAVVKGTSFTVVVDKDRAAVQVTEGVVEVSSATGDARRLVEGGVTVYVGREQPSQIIEMKPRAVDLPASASDSESVKIEGTGDVSLSAVTDLTGGLVREALVAPVVATAKVPAVVTTATTVGVTPSAAPVATTPAVGTPTVDLVNSTVPAGTGTTVPTVIEPVVGVVQATVPAVTDPVVTIVETISVVTAPAVDVVQAVVPTVAEPVIAVVQPAVTAVTQPVVGIVETITQPVGGLLGGLFGSGSNSGPGSTSSGSGSGGGGGGGPGPG